MRSLLYILSAAMICLSNAVSFFQPEINNVFVMMSVFISAWLVMDNILQTSYNRILDPILDSRLHSYHIHLEEKLKSMIMHYSELENENENLRRRLKAEISRRQMKLSRSSYF
jgi:hypothetical protein